MKTSLLIIIHVLIVGCTTSKQLDDKNTVHKVEVVESSNNSSDISKTNTGDTLGCDSITKPDSDTSNTIKPPTLPTLIQSSINSGLKKLCYSDQLYKTKYVSLLKDSQQYSTGTELYISSDKKGYILVEVEIDDLNQIYGGDAHKGELVIYQDNQFSIANIPNKNGYNQLYTFKPSTFYRLQLQDTIWNSLMRSNSRIKLKQKSYLVKQDGKNLKLIDVSLTYYDNTTMKTIVTPRVALIEMNAKHFINN